MITRFRTLAVAILTVLTVTTTFPAVAQQASHVQFEKGNDNAALNGAVTGREYNDYILRARAGQTMAVALTVDDTNGDGSAFFNILPPGSSGAAIFNGSTGGSYGEVRLPEDGDYRIRVYLMGNDKDTGKTVGYNLSVTII